MEEDDYHPPLSPPRTAERLFGLDDILSTQNISAAALAQQIRTSDRTTSLNGFTGETTVATDDFRTAAEPPSSSLLQPPKTPGIIDPTSMLAAIVSPNPPSDILTTNFIPNNFTDDLSTDSGYPNDDDDDNNSESIYQVPSTDESLLPPKSLNLSNIPELTEEVDISMSSNTAPTTEEPLHIDAAEKIYDAAKDVWAWGKGIIVFSPFLGIAEGIASKVVSVASGETLESVDRVVTDQVQTLDDKIFNPAIAFIVHTVLNAAGNTEEILKPIIIKVLTPFGLIKSTAENPEVTPIPGVTVTPATP